jgi:nucleotide-binding universal stress UspA family protein
MKNILVAVDFDAKTKKLIQQASILAEKFKSKIWIIHVAAPDPDFVGYHLNAGIEYIDKQRAGELRKEHKTIQRYAEQLKAKGIQAVGLLVQGATVQTVLDESKKLKIDLIIIGSHKHSFLYRAFAEVTSSAVIKKSKIPLLVVPLD